MKNKFHGTRNSDTRAASIAIQQRKENWVISVYNHLAQDQDGRFALYTEGLRAAKRNLTYKSIAEYLMRANVETASGGSDWSPEQARRLCNEIFKLKGVSIRELHSQNKIR